MRHARGSARLRSALGADYVCARPECHWSERDATRALRELRDGRLQSAWARDTCRFFRDGSPAQTSTQKYDEGTIVARPNLFIGDHFGVSVEGSYQQRRIAIQKSEWRWAAHRERLQGRRDPVLLPGRARRSFKRPQIRLLYVASFRDSGTPRPLSRSKTCLLSEASSTSLGLAPRVVVQFVFLSVNR